MTDNKKGDGFVARTPYGKYQFSLIKTGTCRLLPKLDYVDNRALSLGVMLLLVMVGFIVDAIIQQPSTFNDAANQKAYFELVSTGGKR